MKYSDKGLENCGQNSGAEKRSGGKVLLWMLQMMGTGFFRYLAAIIAMSVALSGFDGVTAFLLREIIARAEQGDGNLTRELWQHLALSVAAGLLFLGVYAIAFITYTMEAKKGGANLQRAMYSKAMRLPYSYYENIHSGDFLSKSMYDCERAQGIYGSRFRRILMPGLMTVGYLIPMFYLNWQVTAGMLAIGVMLLICNSLFFGPMRRMSGRLSSIHSSLTERLIDVLSGMEQIKIFAAGPAIVERYVSDNKSFQKEQNKLNLLSATLEGLNQCMELTGSLVFVALGIFFVGKGITTVENLAAIYVLYGEMSWNLLQVGIYIPSMASYLANARRVQEFLNLEEEPEKAEKGETGNLTQKWKDTCLCMENVTFAYDEKRPVLEQFSLVVPKGKCIALKGESGRGKSTIAKLLLGLYPVQSGELFLNGMEYGDYKLWNIRQEIGYVPQEPYLYHVSVKENIRYGNPQASDEEIVNAAIMANAHEFIEKLEKGYDTIVGERGDRLSGGQRQRIAIARAILKNAPVLLLDEATSALDNESEALVNEALERLMKGRTTIVIAHRQSTLERADEVVEL